MELNELKASWNALDRRLAETEIMNLRIVREIVARKTKSAYDCVIGHNLYNLLVNVLIASVLFPFIYANTPIRTLSFAIVESVILLGLIPQVWKLFLLSGFNLEAKSCRELSRLVLQYKKICHQEGVWVVAGVSIAMVAFYISELGFNDAAGYVIGTRLVMPLALSLLTLVVGCLVALWMRHRHAQQIAEIERGLEELNEFEK